MRVRGTLLAAAAGCCLVALAPPGCSPAAKKKALAIVFDGTEGAPPPRRRVRRDLLREIEQLKRKLAEARRQAEAGCKPPGAAAEKAPPPIENAKTWAEAEAMLPQDAFGNPDWAKALRDGTIAPRPGPQPGAAAQPVLDLDVELVPAAGEMFKVVFAHSTHTSFLTCRNCHTRIFQMQKGATKMSMAEVSAGKFCGVCHGKVAFPTTACGRCHPALAAGG